MISVFGCGLLWHETSGVWGFDLRGLFPGNCRFGVSVWFWVLLRSYSGWLVAASCVVFCVWLVFEF